MNATILPLKHQQRWFWSLIVITFLIKAYFAAIVPITGDEAQYIYWSKHLAWGYYDHPPMVAWLMHPISLISNNNIWLRSIQILLSTLIAILMYKILSQYHKEKAILLASLYLVSPVSLFDIAIVTDTPLILFSFLSIITLDFAFKKDAWSLYFLAGLFMGAAYFSKYLMAPLALSVLIAFLTQRHLHYRFIKLVLFISAGLPFVIENLVWNYHHSWVNFMFNLLLRNENYHGIQWQSAASYLAMMVYLYSPIVLYYCICTSKALLKNSLGQTVGLYTLSFLIPFAFYLLLSLQRDIGLHWVFCAYPFLFMALLPILTVKQIKRCLYFMVVFTAIQALVVAVIFNLPQTFWVKTHYLDKINWFKNYEMVYQQLKPYLKHYSLMTPSYAQSRQFAYRSGKAVPVWGTGSIHGRGDDLTSDFRRYNHKDLLIVAFSKPDIADYAPYFEKTTTKRQAFLGTIYYIILGRNFNYHKYCHAILYQIYKRYYTKIPLWLPYKDFYYQKYFSQR